MTDKRYIRRMLIALIGSLLLIAAVAVYAWGNRPQQHSQQMKNEAARRYALDVQNDDPAHTA